jgi:hypothetical protein
MFTEYCGFNTFVCANGQQPRKKRGTKGVKFFDSVLASTNVLSSGSLLISSCLIPQGTTVTQRTGDTLFLEKLYLNYTVNGANADIISSMRVIVFQWHPNTALSGTPSVTSILQNVGVYGLYNNYDWSFSNQFIILYDRVHSLAGLATAPAASSNQNWFGEIPLTCARKLEYQTGTTTGSEQIFVIGISDSGVIPSPEFTGMTRVTFSEE